MMTIYVGAVTMLKNNPPKLFRCGEYVFSIIIPQKTQPLNKQKI